MNNLMKKVILSLCLLITSSLAKDIGIDEIIKRANNVSYYSGKDGRVKVSMLIKDSQGRKRKRSFVILRKDVNDGVDGDQKFYIYFKRPSDVKNMVFLVWKHLKGEDDRWLYLPALDLVKRIAGSDKRTSFVGSTFFYEDVSGRNLKEDHHKLVNTDKDYYIVENIPKKTEEVEFSKYTAWIHKKTFLPVKIEYSDKKGKVYRRYTALKVEKIQGHNVVTMSKMVDLRTKTETINKYKKVQFDIGLKDSTFTERFLRKPPVKLIGY